MGENEETQIQEEKDRTHTVRKAKRPGNVVEDGKIRQNIDESALQQRRMSHGSV